MGAVIEISFDPPLEEGKVPFAQLFTQQCEGYRHFSSLKTVKTVHGFIDPYKAYFYTGCKRKTARIGLSATYPGLIIITGFIIYNTKKTIVLCYGCAVRLKK